MVVQNLFEFSEEISISVFPELKNMRVLENVCMVVCISLANSSVETTEPKS